MAKKNYEEFPLSLALFDALPVIFFSAAMILIAVNYNNILFVIGAVSARLQGVAKWYGKSLLQARAKILRC